VEASAEHGRASRGAAPVSPGARQDRRRSPPSSRQRWLESARPLDWNGPTGRPFTDLGDAALDQPVIALFEAVVRRWPGRIAVSDARRILSYAELWDAAAGLAHAIAAKTQPGDLVGLLLPAESGLTLAVLACLGAGRLFCVLDPSHPDAWLADALEDVRPRLLLADDGTAARLQTAPTPVLRLSDPAPAAGREWRPTPLGPDAPTCVLFTSGSTGRPKAIVNSQRALLRRALQSIAGAHLNEEDRLLTLASPGTIVAVRDALTALIAGAQIRLLDPQGVGPRQILQAINAGATTVLFGFPALVRSLVACGNPGPGAQLRLVRMGGDTVLWSDIDALRAWNGPDTAIQVLYAATEAPMMQWFVDDGARGPDPRVPIGTPLAGNRLAICDQAGRPAPPGAVGELATASPYVALGVWADGGFQPWPSADEAGARLFRTGDLVRQRPDGLLERLGRIDRQAKIRGARVDLDGVEAALRRHSFVRDAAVIARPTAQGGSALVAYVSARQGASERLLEELKELMRAAPSSMRPSALHLVDEVPRLPGSKLDLKGLAALDEARRPVVWEPRPEGDEIVQAVSAAWRKVLGAPPLDPQQHFFDAGGDSLKAVGLMLELERALGAELPLALINDAPTFGGFCEALRTRRGAAPLVELQAGNGLPPLFLIPGIAGNATELLPLARAIAYPGAVFGLQAHGLTSRKPPRADIEAMAEDYVAAIRSVQPHGPYHLCGYSFGGRVAFEMARRLAGAGEKVDLLALIDTGLRPSWPPRGWMASVRQPQLEPVARLLHVAASGLIASLRHRPGAYPGEIALFMPSQRGWADRRPDIAWRRHARAVTVLRTAGSHLSMIAPENVTELAAAIRARLPDADPGSGVSL
jgi:amino acid adenylation domain-containing protein